jgi:predicted Zn-dependent protease
MKRCGTNSHRRPGAAERLGRRQALGRLGRLAAAVLCAWSLSSCAAIVSDQQEIALGRRYRRELAKQQTLVRSPAALARLNTLGGRLTAAAPPRPAIRYTFEIVRDPELNAFAIPGGHIYVHTGTIRACEDEAELAAVLAHEIGHVSSLHHKQTMARELGLNLINEIVFGEEAENARILAGLVEKGVMLRYSRAQEYQADEIGLRILSRAGYDPSGMPRFFLKLLDKYGSGAKATEFLSSHPMTASRIKRAQGIIATLPPNPNGLRDSPAFQDFRSRF